MAKVTKSVQVQAFGRGEYNGFPLFTFQSSLTEQPFGLGKNKLSKIVNAIKVGGVDEFMKQAGEFLGESAPKVKVAKGTAKVKRGPGRPRKVG